MTPQEYAAAHPTKKGPKCFVCGLKQMKDVEKARDGGLTYSQIAGWLLEDQSVEEATPQRVAAHFRAMHHQRKKVARG